MLFLLLFIVLKAPLKIENKKKKKNELLSIEHGGKKKKTKTKYSMNVIAVKVMKSDANNLFNFF